MKGGLQCDHCNQATWKKTNRSESVQNLGLKLTVSQSTNGNVSGEFGRFRTLLGFRFCIVLFAFFNVIGLFAAVTKGVKRLERNLTLSLVTRRQRTRKEDKMPQKNGTSLTCRFCSRNSASNIGRINHERSCSKPILSLTELTAALTVCQKRAIVTVIKLAVCQ